MCSLRALNSLMNEYPFILMDIIAPVCDPAQMLVANEAIMQRVLKRSNQHFEKAVRRLPLGVTSNFRYWGEQETIYIARGKGARLWDIDGNPYIDYRLGYGPAILGYADSREPWFVCEAHDSGCLEQTLSAFEESVDATLNRLDDQPNFRKTNP